MSKMKCGGCGADYYTTTEQCDTEGCSWTQYEELSQDQGIIENAEGDKELL